MKTAVQIFLKQTLRGKARLLLNSILLLAVTAFFVVGLNLYYNSTSNLHAIENAYTTLATVGFYGDVDAQGNLVSVSDPSYVANCLMSLTGNAYDLSPLLELDMVTGYDLRPRFAAYIPGVDAIGAAGKEIIDDKSTFYVTNEELFPANPQNVIRFVLAGDEPVEVSLVQIRIPSMPMPVDPQTAVAVKLLENVRGWDVPEEEILLYFDAYVEEEAAAYAEELRALNGTDDIDKLILYPGVEYIMHVRSAATFLRAEDQKMLVFEQNYRVDNLGANPNIWAVKPTQRETPFYQPFSYKNRSEGVPLYRYKKYTSAEHYQPFYIQRWDAVQQDPELLAHWQWLSQSAVYSGQSFWVTTTNDMESIPAWYAGGMYLNEGRMITEEEYASGARVCMVSARMAQQQGWSVGDTLDMNLYGGHPYTNDTGTWELSRNPLYQKDADGFFDQGTYTIVGIFGQREISNIGENLPEAYYQPWNTIYVPTNSVQNKPEESTWLIQPSTLSLQLKNGSISEFKQAVEELGLTEQKTGQYQLKFSYFDQGYNKIKPGLDEMHRNAKLLLGLSAALLAVTMVLMAFLFSRQHKHSAGILRILGGSKGQAFTAILACAAVVVLAGGVIGTILGGVLTQSVGASTLGDAAESAAVALSTGASPVLTMLSGIGCMVLFLLLTAVFTATYIGKEPRQLLPQDKG